jgi:hypothetical protein
VRRVRDWIIVGVLYFLGMGLFHVLGGLGAASDTLRRWGEASSTIRSRRAS